jgi:hypothetical protein
MTNNKRSRATSFLPTSDPSPISGRLGHLKDHWERSRTPWVNPRHLEASRSIFSSQCMQNRHQALSNRCKLIFLQKTMLNQKEQRSLSIGPPTRPGDASHRWPARLERSGVSRDSVRTQNGGAERDRTADPLLAKQVLSQLSYSPNLLGTAQPACTI